MQVIRLCEAHQLYSALTYVYNRLYEYRRPVAVLLGATAGLLSPAPAASTHPSHTSPHGASSVLAFTAPNPAVGYKLLAYLRCMFRGEGYPPKGASAAAQVAQGPVITPPSGAAEPRAQLLGSLLFLGAQDLAQEWGVPQAMLLEAGLDGPYPALQVCVGLVWGVWAVWGAIEGRMICVVLVGCRGGELVWSA